MPTAARRAREAARRQITVGARRTLSPTPLPVPVAEPEPAPMPPPGLDAIGRTPEREHLAQVNGRVETALAHLAALESARDRALTERSAIRHAIEEAKTQIEEARRVDSAAVVYAFVSGAMGDASPVQVAQEAIRAGEIRLAENDRIMDAIAREVQAAEQEYERGLALQRSTVSAVIASAPETVRLRAAHERAASVLVTTTALAANLPAIIGPGIASGTVDHGLVAVWRAAAAALAANADAPLPQTDAASDRPGDSNAG